MAAITNAGFEVKVSNHEFDSLGTITGRFVAGSQDILEPEAVSAGFLVVKSSRTPNEGYEGIGPNEDYTIYNTNTWDMVAATAESKASEIYACDPYDVNMIQDASTGEMYKVGANTLGLTVPANYLTTYRKIRFDGEHTYRFGEGLVSGAMEEGTKYTIKDGMLEATTEDPAAGVPYFEFAGTGTFTEGAWAAHNFVDVVAKIAE